MKIIMEKTPMGTLQPMNDMEAEKLNVLKVGDGVTVEVTKKRSYQFHKKYMALLRFGYDYFEPPHSIYDRCAPPQKDFDSFIDWVVIQSGFYTTIGYPDGSVSLKADSISFAKTDEAKFKKMYNAAINVLLQYMGTLGFDREELERVTTNILMGFDQ